MIVPEKILKIVPGFQITGTNRGMVLSDWPGQWVVFRGRHGCRWNTRHHHEFPYGA